jgi:hypothetical protein
MTLLTNEQLDELAFEIPHIKAWLKAVEKEIQDALAEGAELKNAKLEPRLGNRKWVAGADVLKALRKFARLDIVAPRVPLSPTQAEKTLGRNAYAKLVDLVTRDQGTKLVYTYTEE